MRKVFRLSLALVFCSSLMYAETPSKQTDFSGNWVLDLSKAKDLPEGLESYSMIVSQNEQQLKVDASVEGDLRPPRGSSNQESGGDFGEPPEGGMGMPGGPGGGFPGEPGMGGGMPGGGGPPQTMMAIMLFPRSAAFNLDGSESTAQIGGGKQNAATLKATWAGSGETLKLSVAGKGQNRRGGGEMQLKDQWKLSKDGQTLTVDRSINSPRGTETVRLTFHKQAATPASGTAPAPTE